VPGAGTTFTVLVPFGSAHLPRERIQAKATGVPTSVKAAIFVEEALRWMPANQPAALPPAAGENAPRILLADDNADMRDYARRLLEPHYRVETVGDGEAALAIAKDRPPDLILTDVMMPGLDGFELLRRLRQDERTRRIPVVMLSARAGEEARIEGLSAGAEDYLSKPFSARELLARVRTHLELSRLREELRGQREQLYALFMQAPVPICVFRGQDLVFEMANPCYLEVSGRGDVVGKPFLEALPDARGQGFDDLLRRVMATGVPYVGKEHLARLDRDHDGVLEDTWFDFIYAPIRDEHGVAERVMAVVHDVSEKVLERRLVEQREERLRVMFETAEVSIWDEDLSAVKRLVDQLAEKHGAGLRAFLEAHPEVVEQAIGLVQVRDVNPATLRLFGASDKAQLLQSLHAIFVEQTRPVFLAEMLALAEGRTSFSGEAPMRTLAGDPITVLISWGAAHDDRAYQRVLVTLMDMSAQNLAGTEREARVAQMERALRFSELWPASSATT
jgi:CheY-like chemotaxis protein